MNTLEDMYLVIFKKRNVGYLGIRLEFLNIKVFFFFHGKVVFKLSHGILKEGTTHLGPSLPKL